MNNWFIWLIALGAVLSPFVYLAGTFWNLFLTWRTHATSISGIPGQGWVEVTGRIRGEQVTSQLNNTACAFCQLEVKEYQGSGKGGGRWRTIHKESSGPFEVDDMTGRVTIQTSGNIDLVLENEISFEHPDDSIKAKLENLGIKTKGFLGFNKKLRVYERLIAPGEEILVLGKFQKDPQAISISNGSITPSVISNMGKTETIKTYFWRSIKPMLLPYLISIFFLAFFIYSITR
jgi:hypothetical protein